MGGLWFTAPHNHIFVEAPVTYTLWRVLEYLEGDEQQYQPRGKSTLELMQPQPIKNIIFRDYAAYFGYDPIVHLLVIPKVLQARMIQFWQLSLKSPYNDKETFNFKKFLKLELFNVQIQLA